MRATIAAEPEAHLDYVSVAHPSTLEELDQIEEGALLSLAVFVGETRLIDNVVVVSSDS
jgi:pantoate--beta-alanine ligase